MGILWRTFLSEIYKILLEDWGLLYLQPIEIYIQIGNHCVQNVLFLCNHFIFLLITPSARNTLCEQIKDRTQCLVFTSINQACAYIFYLCLNISKKVSICCICCIYIAISTLLNYSSDNYRNITSTVCPQSAASPGPSHRCHRYKLVIVLSRSENTTTFFLICIRYNFLF